MKRCISYVLVTKTVTLNRAATIYRAIFSITKRKFLEKRVHSNHNGPFLKIKILRLVIEFKNSKIAVSNYCYVLN